MIVYFLRHASAGQRKSDPKLDARRPLDKEGIGQSTTIGRMLASAGVQVDTIVSSPLKRATQTASLVANEIGSDGKLLFSAALSTDAKFDDFRTLLQAHATAEAIMVVGHNPSLSQFLSLLLTQGGTDKVIDLKKGAVARVDVDSRHRAVLRWCITPKLVRSFQDSAGTSSRPKTSRK